MAYQITIILTDAEYRAFSVEEDIQAYLFHRGLVTHIPSNKPDTREEDAERHYLAHLFSHGKPASEMVIEDRGPR